MAALMAEVERSALDLFTSFMSDKHGSDEFFENGYLFDGVICYLQSALTDGYRLTGSMETLLAEANACIQKGTGNQYLCVTVKPLVYDKFRSKIPAVDAYDMVLATQDHVTSGSWRYCTEAKSVANEALFSFDNGDLYVVACYGGCRENVRNRSACVANSARQF
jgi:hypothetical protein